MNSLAGDLVGNELVNLRGNLKGLNIMNRRLPRVNKITTLIKSQINPQKSYDELYSEALNMFVDRIVKGGY